MNGFLWGTVFGIVVSTVGFSGIAAVADWGLDNTKTVLQDTAEKAEDAKAKRVKAKAAAKKKEEDTEE